MKTLPTILMTLFLVLTTTQCKEKSDTKPADVQQADLAPLATPNTMDEDSVDEDMLQHSPDSDVLLNQTDGTNDKAQNKTHS